MLSRYQEGELRTIVMKMFTENTGLCQVRVTNITDPCLDMSYLRVFSGKWVGVQFFFCSVYNPRVWCGLWRLCTAQPHGGHYLPVVPTRSKGI